MLGGIGQAFDPDSSTPVRVWNRERLGGNAGAIKLHIISPALAWWLDSNSAYSFAWQREQFLGVGIVATVTPSCSPARGFPASTSWQEKQPTPAAAWRDPCH
jgi:hypothetical protein